MNDQTAVNAGRKRITRRNILIVPKFLINVICLGISATCIFPFIWLAYSSLKPNTEFVINYFSLPKTVMWENYYNALIKSKILYFFGNTLLNSAMSVAVILFFGFCIAYFLARYEFFGKKFVYGLLSLGMIMPIHSLLVPMYIQYKIMGMIDHRGVLILPYMGVMLPLTVFLLEAYIKTIPKEMEQSASIEGASLFYTLVRIIVPLAKPAIITMLIIVFNNTWNEFPFALILSGKEHVRNISVGLMNFTSMYDVEWTQRIAASMVAVMPVAILYTIFNKQIIKGMTDGALKG